jgi:hypothetical protein
MRSALKSQQAVGTAKDMDWFGRGKKTGWNRTPAFGGSNQIKQSMKRKEGKTMQRPGPTCYIVIDPTRSFDLGIDPAVQQELAGQMLAENVIGSETFSKLA